MEPFGIPLGYAQIKLQQSINSIFVFHSDIIKPNCLWILNAHQLISYHQSNGYHRGDRQNAILEYDVANAANDLPIRFSGPISAKDV